MTPWFPTRQGFLIENHKYLRFATSFLTLGGNLLRDNRFFLICVFDSQTRMRYGIAPMRYGNAPLTADTVLKQKSPQEGPYCQVLGTTVPSTIVPCKKRGIYPSDRGIYPKNPYRTIPM
jgi:hypothetical protein